MCGGPWVAYSGAVEAHPTLEYQKIKGDKKYVEHPPTLVVEAPGYCPACPLLNPALVSDDNITLTDYVGYT